ncbi:HEPN domain-containing protein [Olivibacter sp. XZL3]|uniref:HEPN domain-containing protein n=1 Tax=Olivibacter sp. XZL3 TaxID=1735116 RepID=UPI001066959C|nr:HEPN domain-containing protein [Olivibacter sp. XZL3]
MNKIKTILKTLAEKIPVDCIYEFPYSFLGNEKFHLLVVIDPKCQVATKTLEPMAELCLPETRLHSYSLIPYGELKTAIKNGTLHYSLACRKQHLKLSLGKKPIPDLTRTELESIRTKAREHYEKATTKQRDFLDGMEFYCNKENFEQALFMLHQAAELTFRGIEQAIFKRDRPSHSLQEHIKLIAKYIPPFVDLVGKENPYRYRLLKLIDQSYTAVRYQRQFDVEKEEIDQLILTLIPVLDWCNDYYRACIAELDGMIQQSSNQPEVGSTMAFTPTAVALSFPDTLIKQLGEAAIKTLTAICTNLIKRESLQQLVLIGHEAGESKKVALYQPDAFDAVQTPHCFLLGIGSGKSTSKSHTIVHTDIRVTVILCACPRASQALEKKNRFFLQTLNHGTTLFIDADKGPFTIPKPDWSMTLEKAKAVWNYRKYKADTFLACADQALRERQDTQITIFLLSQSMEQLCVGLIYACLGYHADQSTIPFLLQVTKLISPQLADCFAFGGDTTRQALKSLANSLPAIRYKKEAAPSDIALATAMACYERFYAIAKLCCTTNFSQLEKQIQQACAINQDLVETAVDAPADEPSKVS